MMSLVFQVAYPIDFVTLTPIKLKLRSLMIYDNTIWSMSCIKLRYLCTQTLSIAFYANSHDIAVLQQHDEVQMVEHKRNWYQFINTAF